MGNANFTRNDLSAQDVRALLAYDEQTGMLTWKIRPGNDRDAKKWNTRHAGKRAGGLTPQGRISISVHNRRYLAHRLCWLIARGRWPINQLDHINHDPADNRLENLREADYSENGANRSGAPRNSTTGIRGVTYKAKSKKFQAYVTKHKRMKHLGFYDTAEEAAAVAAAERRCLFGTFAGGV